MREALCCLTLPRRAYAMPGPDRPGKKGSPAGPGRATPGRAENCLAEPRLDRACLAFATSSLAEP